MTVVQSERLVLRRLSASDAPVLTPVFCDPEVMRYSDGLRSASWVREWITEVVEVSYARFGFGPWAIARKSDREVLGYCGLSRAPDRCAADEAELGFRLARVHWGRGYGTEAAAACCDYGLRTLGLSGIVAIVDPGNHASLRVIHKIGMRFEREIEFPHYSHADHLYVIRAKAAGHDD